MANFSVIGIDNGDGTFTATVSSGGTASQAGGTTTATIASLPLGACLAKSELYVRDAVAQTFDVDPNN